MSKRKTGLTLVKKAALENRNRQVNSHMKLREQESKWEELENIYLTAANSIVTTLKSVSDLANFPGLNAYLDNPNEFNIALAGFNRDINMFTDKLVAIHNLHSHLTGNITGPDEVAKSYAIYGEYTTFFEEFKALTFQTVLSITESASSAMQKMQAIQRKNEENTITLPATVSE